jgi:hypothetical protein
MMFTELAGLPLTMLQPVCFIWAVMSRDVLSALVFLWRGPGFIAVAIAVMVTKAAWHVDRLVPRAPVDLVALQALLPRLQHLHRLYHDLDEASRHA